MKGRYTRKLLSLIMLTSVATFVATPSIASVNSRLDQLERVANAQSQVINQIQKDLRNTQMDIDQLRGQIETNQYQLNQVIERQKSLFLKLDELQKIPVEDGIASAQTTSQAVNSSPSASAANVEQNTPASAGNQSSQSQSVVVDERAEAASEEDVYETAISLVMKEKKYDQAIIAFQNFNKTYPDSPKYSANANFWLGQLYYNRGNADDASYYYAVVVKKYPKSPKAVEALYKIGLIMQEKGETSKAKGIYQQLIKVYPNTETTELARKRLQEL